jgi:hypothetical protein
MRKLLSSLFALGAILLTLPANAQSISALSVNQNVAVGGQTLTAQLALSAPPQVNSLTTTFSLSPAVVVLQPLVSIQSGARSATFRIQTLPVDRPVTTTIGVAMNGSTQFAQITVLPSQPFYSRFLTYRPDSSTWTLRDNADGSTTTIQFGEPGDQPLPIVLDPGATAKQLVVFRRSTAQWFVRGLDGSTRTIQFGMPGDIPAPSNYLGTGRTQIAVLRPSTKQLFIRRDDGSAEVAAVPFIQDGDQPVTNDFLGMGRAQFAVYRPTSGEWFIRQDDGSAIRIQFGLPGDNPVMADFLGLGGRKQIAVFRPSTGEWHIRQDDGSDLTILFGTPNDVPRPGDYLGLGRDLIGVARPDTGEWFFRNDTGDAIKIPFGEPGVEFVPDWFTPRLASR